MRNRAPDRAAVPRGTAGRRLLLAAGAGVVVGVVVALLAGFEYGPVALWLTASILFLVLTWTAVWPMDAARTARWATREDPTIGASHAALLVASLASLGGVALLLMSAHRGEEVLAALLGVASVAASWVTVHTLYTLQYAAAYYSGTDGGVDFNQEEPPAYADFAYLGFTLGMTYQVSDTTVSDPVIRRLVLAHSLLSYVLGAVVLAIAINLIGTLAA